MKETNKELEQEVPNWVRLILKISNTQKSPNKKH